MTLLPGNARILVATDDVQQILLEPHQVQFSSVQFSSVQFSSVQFSSVVRRLLCNGYYIDKYIKRE